ncbi:MAG: (5-formylfuran-3-yl)methyl phosphate synthase, partial [Gammaproteobacteria bacterium]
MTGMLASVADLDEALEVLSVGVDIIDLKRPAHGALGALDTDTVAAIVDRIQGRCPLSATIGDLPMEPNTVSRAV